MILVVFMAFSVSSASLFSSRRAIGLGRKLPGQVQRDQVWWGAKRGSRWIQLVKRMTRAEGRPSHGRGGGPAAARAAAAGAVVRGLTGEPALDERDVGSLHFGRSAGGHERSDLAA